MRSRGAKKISPSPALFSHPGRAASGPPRPRKCPGRQCRPGQRFTIDRSAVDVHPLVAQVGGKGLLENLLVVTLADAGVVLEAAAG